ncbi:hypothetical protein ADUPG1_014204 [Aduncisulcus paluster]|uniref:non-specific serine/threonine protein kinase n=1 Tax=Aduncisulcus paluster TaxID=2918883 RepID=A0ABQ5KB59_9EUKA|nr:hypothetical protein ADUPG1_014204 [Aduncisulcus paluster]
MVDPDLDDPLTLETLKLLEDTILVEFEYDPDSECDKLIEWGIQATKIGVEAEFEEDMHRNHQSKCEESRILASFVKKGCSPFQDYLSEFHLPRCDPPICYDDPFVIKINENSRFFTEYSGSELVHKTLLGTGNVSFTSLSFPFISVYSVKGIYMQVRKDSGPQHLLLTFTHDDGSITQKYYDFIQPKYMFEWHYLPVKLDNVIMCDIDGGERWIPQELIPGQAKSKSFERVSSIEGIIFVRPNRRETIISHLAPHLGNPEFSSLEEENAELWERLYQQKIKTERRIKKEIDKKEHQIKEQTTLFLQIFKKHDKMLTSLAKQLTLVSDELSKKEKSISTLRSKVSDLESKLLAQRQTSEQEILTMGRKNKSLQLELSFMESRLAGNLISLSNDLQTAYDSTVRLRKTIFGDVSKFVGNDITKWTNETILSNISCLLWFMPGIRSGMLFLRIISFLRSLQNCTVITPSKFISSCGASYPTSPLVFLNGLYNSFHSLHNIIFTLSQRQSSSLISPRDIVSESLYPIPSSPCLKTLNNRVSYLKSLFLLVSSHVNSDHVSCVIETGKRCVSQLKVFLSHIVGITDLECPSTSHLLSACDHVSDEVINCLRHFSSSERSFDEALSQYNNIIKHSRISLDKLGSTDKDEDIHDSRHKSFLSSSIDDYCLILNHDSWDDVISEIADLCELSYDKLSYGEGISCGISKEREFSSKLLHHDEDDISSKFLTSVPFSQDIDSSSPCSVSSISTFLNHDKTRSVFRSTIERLESSSSVSSVYSQYSLTMESITPCVDTLSSCLWSHIFECISQSSLTDSTIISLKGRINGDLTKTGPIGILDLQDCFKEQCKHEKECLTALSNVLKVDCRYARSCESIESVIGCFTNCICSVLDICTEYLHKICEYRCGILCCILRMSELCSWRESVSIVEKSEDEIENLNAEMLELRKLMKGKQMKKEVLIHTIQTQNEKLIQLQDRSKSSSKGYSFKFGLDDEDDEEEYEENVEELTRSLRNNEKKLDKFAKNISTIRCEMNKRYLRCIELQKHASALSSVGFSIPSCLDESLILSYPCVGDGGTDCDDQDEGDADRMGIRRSFGKDEGALPLIFSTGVALGMFSDIQEIRSSGGSDTMSKDRFLHEGNVFSARWQLNDTTRDVVLKFIDIPNDGTGSSDISHGHYRTLLRSAFSARTGSDCPYIISLLSVFYDEHVLTPSKTGAYLVFPFYSNGDMNYWLKKAPRSISSVRLVLKSILHALVHLHRNGIVHCDLKPQNVLIDSDGHGVLCDFEAAVDSSNRMIGILSQTMRVGTPGFIAPELQKSMDAHRHPHPKPSSDIYSFGILLREVFQIMSNYEINPISMPSNLRIILDSCLSLTPSDRPTATKILANKWFL